MLGEHMVNYMVNTTRFLKYVWPFFNILYEKVNRQHIKIELINSKTKNRHVLTLQELKTDSEQN